MTDKVKEALFKTFEIREKARAAQADRGNSDQGERAGATSGKHLDPIADVIVEELRNAGVKENDLYSGNINMELPGWFRPNKQWDILAFEKDMLIAAIELKSIYSSFGNNFNNRTEEALGSATDANIATRYQMFGDTTPPAFGYVMIVKSTDSSRKIIGRIKEPHFKTDPIFQNDCFSRRWMEVSAFSKPNIETF